VPWMGVPLERVGLVTLDAHFDLRDRSNGDHNGTPVRALLDAGLPGKQICQIGIQRFANSSAYAHVADEAAITYLPHYLFDPEIFEKTEELDAVYFDFDIDVIDRYACPGAPGARPGGMMPAEFLEFCYQGGLLANVKACDFIEFDPERDINQVTAMTIASGMLHFMAGVMDRP
jgi:formiminoglutamase